MKLFGTWAYLLKIAVKVYGPIAEVSFIRYTTDLQISVGNRRGIYKSEYRFDKFILYLKICYLLAIVRMEDNFKSKLL